jgi:hypothetical protein
MGYHNPYKARMARWRKQWPVPLAELQAQAYAVLQLAYEGVTVDDDEQRRKNILCYFQGLTAFTRLQEACEIEARVTALETALTDRSNGHYGALP